MLPYIRIGEFVARLSVPLKLQVASGGALGGTTHRMLPDEGTHIGCVRVCPVQGVLCADGHSGKVGHQNPAPPSAKGPQ